MHEKPARPSGASIDALGAGNSPPLMVPLPFFIAGALAFVLANLAMLIPSGVSAQTAWSLGLVYLAVAGWLTFATMGQLYKILPFLVWLHPYSERVGLEPVPLLRDLYVEPRDQIAFWVYVVGFLIVSGTLLAGNTTGVRLGGLLTLAGGAGFAWTFAEVLRPRRSATPKPAGSPR